MMDDLTRKILTREGQRLSQPVYKALDRACAETRAALRFDARAHPHLHGQYRRAALRDYLEAGELPAGWVVRGNPRLNGQLFLANAAYSVTLRVLSESTVTSNGVPHAGYNAARREAWSVPLPLFDSDLGWSGRDLLMLCGIDGEEPTIRLVRTVEPGRFNGTVQCDFGLPLLRDGSSFNQTTFATDSDEIDLFSVTIVEGESDSV